MLIVRLVPCALRHLLHVHDRGALHAEALPDAPPGHQCQRLRGLRLLRGGHHAHRPRSGASPPPPPAMAFSPAFQARALRGGGAGGFRCLFAGPQGNRFE